MKKTDLLKKSDGATDVGGKTVVKIDRHTLSCLVENRSGVLARVAGLFSARGYNIDSLAVGETEDPTVSRMTIVVNGDERVLEQVLKQLDKLVDVIKVTDYRATPHIEGDLAFIKVKSSRGARARLKAVYGAFDARVIDESPETSMVEITGDERKIQQFLKKLEPFGILEMCRTGIVAMARGKNILSLKSKSL